MNYTLTEPNVLPIYEHARQDPNLRVLVYNGGRNLKFTVLPELGGRINTWAQEPTQNAVQH